MLAEELAEFGRCIRGEAEPGDGRGGGHSRARRVLQALEAQPRPSADGAGLSAGRSSAIRFAAARTSASCAAARATSTTSTRPARRMSRSCAARSRTRASAASSVPDGGEGVFAVITAADLEGRVRRPAGAGLRGRRGVRPRATRCSPRGEVRYAGQPVARGAGRVARARRGCRRAGRGRLRAARAGAGRAQLGRHDEPTGTRSAATSTARSSRPRTWCAASHALPRLAPVPMEPRGAIASLRRGRTTCSRSGCRRRTATASWPASPTVLDRPEESIHVIVPDVGGAFGSKGAPAPETMLVARRRRSTTRPDRQVGGGPARRTSSPPTRGAAWRPRSSWRSTPTRRIARRARPHLGGPRRLPDADHGDPPHTTAMLMCGVYDIQRGRRRAHGQRARTRCPPGPTAAPGGPRPPTSWSARSTSRRASSGSTRSSCGAATSSASSRTRRRSAGPTTPATTRAASTWRRSSWSPSAARTTSASWAPASAMYVERAGGLFETAEAELLPDGRLLVRSGSSPHGQGHDTTFAQLAAERLGVGLEDVELRFGDSKEVPRGVGTFASRSVAMGGSAVVQAVDALKEKCAAVAGGTEHVAARGGGGRAGARGRARASSPTSSSRRAPTEPSSRSSAPRDGCGCCGSRRSTTPARS